MTEALYPLLSSVPLITGTVLLLAACLDFLYYRLPNKLFFAIFYLFPVYIILSFKFHLFSNYLVFVATILVGLGLFATSMIGGGDVKLLAAVSLWAGWNNMVPFLLWTLILGSIVSCIYLLFPRHIHYLTAQLRHFVQKQSILKNSIQFLVSDIDTIEEEVISLQQKKMIPYGIAIAGAGLIILSKRII